MGIVIERVLDLEARSWDHGDVGVVNLLDLVN